MADEGRASQWEYKEFWDNPGRAHQQRLHDFHRFGLELIPKAAGKRCLDLGSASGDFAVKLASLGYEVVASDFDERALLLERGKGLDAVKLNVESDRFPFPDGGFDLVTCFELIEHIKSPAHMLSEIRRVLKDDGTLVISTPNIAWWYLRLKHLRGVWDMHDPDHIRFYTPALLERMLKDSGYVVVDRRSYFVCPHVKPFGIMLPPEPLRVFKQPGFHGISYDFIFKCRKGG